MDDTGLVRLVVQSDRQAFMAFYDRYTGRVPALTMSILGYKLATEEDEQDAFSKIWTNADGYHLLAYRRTIRVMSPFPQHKSEVPR